MFRILLLFILTSTNLWSESTPSTWYTKSAHKVILQVELFLSSTCQHCHQEDIFFKSIEASNPWLQVNRHVINNDKSALILFDQLLTEQKMSDYAVPSAFFCNSRWIGFNTKQTSGQSILKALEYCKHSIEKNGGLSEAAVKVLRQQAIAYRGTPIMNAPSPLENTLLSAMMDMLNPCSLFGIFAFLGLLWMQDKAKMQVQLGLLFIATIGFVHCFQQLLMVFYFSLFDWFRIPAALIGLFLIHRAHLHYKKIKVPVSVLVYLEAFLLALMIGWYQQTCILNWTYLYVLWQNNQNLSFIQTLFYQIIYQSVYVLNYIFFLFLCLLLRSKSSVNFKQGLNTLGLLLVGAIGLILIINPQSLSSILLSYIVFCIVLIFAWYIHRRHNA
ncbi:MAG: hypothetical protein H0U75_08955 [Legionella sp.]|nr:hypothetical protein [Legionella sp.]